MSNIFYTANHQKLSLEKFSEIKADNYLHLANVEIFIIKLIHL